MNKIKFTTGTIVKISEDYYNLTLFNGEKQVYKVTLPRLDAAEMINKHYPKISLQQ